MNLCPPAAILTVRPCMRHLVLLGPVTRDLNIKAGIHQLITVLHITELVRVIGTRSTGNNILYPD